MYSIEEVIRIFPDTNYQLCGYCFDLDKLMDEELINFLEFSPKKHHKYLTIWVILITFLFKIHRMILSNWILVCLRLTHGDNLNNEIDQPTPNKKEQRKLDRGLLVGCENGMEWRNDCFLKLWYIKNVSRTFGYNNLWLLILWQERNHRATDISRNWFLSRTNFVCNSSWSCRVELIRGLFRNLWFNPEYSVI